MTHQSSKIPPQKLYSLIEQLTTTELIALKKLIPDGANGVQWVDDNGALFAEWGNITGDIENQLDLSLVASTGLIKDLIIEGVQSGGNMLFDDMGNGVFTERQAEITDIQDLGDVLSSKLGNTIEGLIDGNSLASSQEPTSLDTPIQVEYGAAQISPQVELDALGTVLFKESGLYYVTIHAQYGAPGGGGEAALRFRAELNGTPYGDVFSATVKDAKTSVPFYTSFWIDAVINDEIKTFLLRDSIESNKGGLFQEPTTLTGWDSSPSAAISIQRFV